MNGRRFSIREGETTDQDLLARLGDWADQPSWFEFVRRYDPVIRRHCRSYRYDPDTLEELCQRIWIELARRLRTYQYDPGRRFRYWLGRFCRSRAIDLWRQRKLEAGRTEGDAQVESLAATDPVPEQEIEPDITELLLAAGRIQEAVRRRVDDRTWGIFWSIAIEGEPVRETAQLAGLSYAAAFAAQKRVRRMLCEEAGRLAPAGGLESD